MNHWIRRTTLLLCCFTSLIYAAPERQYDVQVLVFSHLTPDTLQSETWPVVSPAIFNTNATQTDSASELTHEKNALMKNPHYQILLDGSWPETWRSGQSTVTIPLAGGSNAGAKLSGYMTIALSHYFDVHTDLFLTEPTNLLKQIDPTLNIDQSSFSFHLLQNRRMRSNELNYLDYPVIGVLIKIIPIK
ncbi:MAG: hypothetical protein A3E82_05140 [Gammaproteobacteria bacterium RIFCSPHIGHO2_12_FULL_38_11]|nr:MAG: hypothetical protein A3E82_05140 [Gammaproteobacteria bacterium RIFCSPHIGHO2_12_FULL_38_11]